MERLIKLRMVFSSLKKAKTFFFPSSCWLAVVWQKSRELGGRDGGSAADRRLLCLSPVVVQSLSRVRLSATPWTAAHLASLSFTISGSLLKLMSIESVMPSSHLTLCHPLLLLPPIPTSIRVFSNESALRMRWSKYWSFSFSISPSNEHPGLILRMDSLDLLQSKGLSRVFSSTTVQNHQFFGTQSSLWSNSHICT